MSFLRLKLFKKYRSTSNIRIAVLIHVSISELVHRQLPFSKWLNSHYCSRATALWLTPHSNPSDEMRIYFVCITGEEYAEIDP